MAKKIVKYIGFYDLPNSKGDRVSNLAAINKMNYIASAINRAGYDVEIVSSSWMGDKSEILYEKQNKVKIKDGVSVVFCPSWLTKNKITRNIKIMFTLIWLLVYLLITVKRDEKIFVYHVQWISLPIRISKFVKGFDLVLEVEEIYQDVKIVNSFFTNWENKLLNTADSFLFSTELLKERVKNHKPYITIYGEYYVHEQLNSPKGDGKIHLLYAGIIDSHKKGAFKALEAAKFLNEKYHLHIIGFGETEKLCYEIENHNKANKCLVTFDGKLSGSDYIKFCQSCHIGLSTQALDGKYLETSFPSKILSYLSMGLIVVSGYIDCVSKSKIGNMVNYYYDDNPSEIADVIRNIDITLPYNSKKVIRTLDDEFVNRLRVLMEAQDVATNR